MLNDYTCSVTTVLRATWEPLCDLPALGPHPYTSLQLEVSQRHFRGAGGRLLPVHNEGLPVRWLQPKPPGRLEKQGRIGAASLLSRQWATLTAESHRCMRGDPAPSLLWDGS